MNTRILCAIAACSLALFSSGCVSRSDARLTNPQQPGPALGTAVGTAAGAVAGNVAAIPAAAAEAAVATAKAPFSHEKRVIRTWKKETTADGRVIDVAVEVEVDASGRPISEPVVK